MMDLDRRHSRISVSQLRRDLREADEDRFRLTVALAQLGRRHNGTPRLLAIALLVTGGLGSAVGTTMEAPTATMAQVTTAPAIAADTRPMEIAAPKVPVSESVRSSFRSTTRTARSVTRTVSRTPELVVLRQAPPRPLSPGEFGRPRPMRLTKVTRTDAN